MTSMQNKKMKIVTYAAGKWEEKQLNVINEQSVTLTVNNAPWISFMCTPVDLEALALGFLFNEEIIQTLDDVASLRVCPGKDNIDVWLNRSINRPDKWIKTSGCSGGTTSIVGNAKLLNYSISKNGIYLQPEKIGALISRLLEAQELYKQSGGVHTSALSDGEKIFITAEDIGRHNTLDKLAGRCLIEQIHPRKTIILTTGRISSEMIQKAGRLEASFVISRTSPTTLSCGIAEELGITLIGYARRDSFTIYSHAERVQSVPAIKSTSSEAR